MRAYLLFRLYGPMAAWGDTSVGEFRPTRSHPSRTAILGLLAAALGIRRDQEDELLALDGSAGVAVRLDLPGELLRDYHTTQVAPEGKKLRYRTRSDELNSERLHTILSQRDYRTDTGASIALYRRGEDKNLEHWCQALRTPVFSLYLGRKSCPLALPLDPVVVQAPDLKAAFDAYPSCNEQLAVFSGRDMVAPSRLVRYYCEGLDESLKPDMSYPSSDRLLSRKRWQYAVRDEYSATLTRFSESPSDVEER